jgi:hypothetical protein
MILGISKTKKCTFASTTQANSSLDYARLRKQSEKLQLGWGIEFNTFRVKKSGFVIGTGLGDRKSWVKFRYQKEEEQELLTENIPEHFLIDLTTMDTMGIQFGDVVLNHDIKRNVQHFNEFQTLSILIHIGFFKPKRKITFGILGGISYQFSLKQKGQLFDESGSIIDFKDDSYFKKSNFSTHLKPLLAMKLGSNYQLTLSHTLAFSLTDQIKNNSAISQRPITNSLSIGLIKMLVR